MKKLDNIRSSQNQRQTKKEIGSIRAKHAKERRTPAFRAFVITIKVMIILLILSVAAFIFWIYSQTEFSFGDNLGTFEMRLSSTIYCPDEKGIYSEYEQFKSTENRIWVDIDKVPENMQDAFVAIEDQRFYEHHGVDLKRTMGAVLNVFVKGDSSYGGSTITQQLVKNITNDNARTNSRKIREITRALVLETKMTKSQILEMYMNSIYLSQGTHGIQAAAKVYFGKTVNQLTLAECASIAGITQYPTTYDPILHPESNKKKQLVVLAKMLELGYISENEYNEAVNEELLFNNQKEADEETEENVQSYFADYIFEQAKKDMMKEFGYTDQFTEDLLCNGGLKIYATVDPEIQSKIEEYYEKDTNFPLLSGNERPESAIIICDPSTGYLKGIVGGTGKKKGVRILNRATQSLRQPGSTIKPIAVYGPALEENIINLATTIENSKLTIKDWTPTNANGRYSGYVTVKNAVAYSYNLPAIRTLEEVGVENSYDYLKNKMHINSIVKSETKNGKEYSDINLSSLALGGLTDGLTALDINAAYCCFANGGVYIEPTSYTKIYNKNNKLFYEKKQKKNQVFSKETAFLMQQLLNGVVRHGTAAGSEIPGIETCGKTGTTDDNKDKWFIGFTPYYCSTVWVGFDNPKVINTGTNPALSIWKNIVPEIHKGLDDKSFKLPSGIVKAKLCGYTGLYESGYAANEYANKRFLTGYCKGNHKNHIGTPGKITTSSYNTHSSGKTNDAVSNEKKNTTKSSSGKTSTTQTPANKTADETTPMEKSTEIPVADANE